MFSNKENINILTSLLVGHGIRHVIACPGSRNAPMIHNFNECPDITCHPVTDERSACFYAIGMMLATGEPVAVCVTSGTALLNLAPAVAEAYYQKLPLVVISADRPAAYINQLDGQTLPQDGVLGIFARKSVNVPEPKDDIERWHCMRMINEALIECKRYGGAPVHINMPVAEPLFEFSSDSLPETRVLKLIPQVTDRHILEQTLVSSFRSSCRPMILIGQLKPGSVDATIMEKIKDKAIIISESVGCASFNSCFDEVLCGIDNATAFLPDFIIYIGGTIVSKRLKKFLRTAVDADVWRVDEDGDVHDTFMNLGTVIQGVPDDVLEVIANEPVMPEHSNYVVLWGGYIGRVASYSAEYEPAFSQMAVVKYFEEQLADMDYDYAVHYANSSAIRLANIYADHHVLCNRGVNGIEGSLSVAAGHSVVYGGMVFCVTGDLSFFYDQNALWNTNLSGNLRIILLNNGCGGIFYRLEGLSASLALDKMVAGGHATTAQGICVQNDIGYMKAEDMNEMQIGVVTLLTSTSKRPVLLEIFTDETEDKRALDDYYGGVMELLSRDKGNNKTV